MGRLDVDAMLAELDSDQLLEWMAWERIEGPYTERRADWRAAIGAAAAHGAMGGKKRPSDFLAWKEPERFKTVAELKMAMAEVKAAVDGAHTFGGAQANIRAVNAPAVKRSQGSGVRSQGT